MENIKELELSAMQMILHAGDGRLAVMNALDAIADGDYQKAEMMLDDAHTELVNAHSVQTDILQKVASQELKETYSILFTHAQDTLMTIYSEYNIAKKIMKISVNLERKIMMERK